MLLLNSLINFIFPQLILDRPQLAVFFLDCYKIFLWIISVWSIFIQIKKFNQLLTSQIPLSAVFHEYILEHFKFPSEFKTYFPEMLSKPSWNLFPECCWQEPCRSSFSTKHLCTYLKQIFSFEKHGSLSSHCSLHLGIKQVLKTKPVLHWFSDWG